METRLDGAERPADPLRDRSERQVRPVVQHHDSPLVIGQDGHRPDGLVAVEELAEGVSDAAWWNRVKRDEADAASPPEAVATDVDEDAIEPRLESGRIAEGRCRLPGTQQGVLHGVLGLSPIGQEEARQAIGAVKLASRLLQEALGERIAAGCRQLSLREPTSGEQRSVLAW